jgi:hypothetical protein
MPYYRPCPLCGATLDPGERCDCQDKEKAAPVLEHRDGPKVDQKLTDPRSTSILTKE